MVMDNRTEILLDNIGMTYKTTDGRDVTASILVDTLQGGNGLGCMLSQSLKGGMTRLVFWDIVLIIAVIGILSYWLMGVIERLLCPYKRKKGGKCSALYCASCQQTGR